jgi:hypothetical protein
LALFWVVLVTEIIAVSLDLCLARLISKSDGREYLGGLQGIWWVIWCMTFVISSTGIIMSFFLHLLNSQGWVVVYIFACMNIAHIVFDIALMYRFVNLVFWSLLAMLISYIALLVHTYDVFGISPILVVVHICNNVAVVHGLVLDLLVWQSGWHERIVDII